ncbi:MAG TPA: hypothetical protein VEA78_08555 [Acidimicrobiales bacterium]|nr:hypothetical protein [Acidimicrobiales bacterium]
MRLRTVTAVALVVVLAATLGTLLRSDDPTVPVAVAGTTSTSSTTVMSTTTTVVLPPPTTTTLPPTTTTVAPPPPTTVPPPPAKDLSVYNGLGTWIDVYDWSLTFGKDGALVDATTVDQMAAAGVQTLYVQTGKWDAPTDVLEPDRLLPIIERAHARGMRVVGWYLPTFEDPQRDMARLMAASRLPIDALAVDIESLRFKDVPERNRRLLEISTNLRRELPGVVLGAIPYPPVVTDVINPSLWPSFPWAELAPLYDVWLPMSYQSDRKQDSGYRDAYRYLAENIDRMRAHLGADVPIHAIGGIADRTSPADVAALHRAALERGVLGGSLYDWRTTQPDLWSHLQIFRAG